MAPVTGQNRKGGCESSADDVFQRQLLRRSNKSSNRSRQERQSQHCKRPSVHRRCEPSLPCQSTSFVRHTRAHRRHGRRGKCDGLFATRISSKRLVIRIRCDPTPTCGSSQCPIWRSKGCRGSRMHPPACQTLGTVESRLARLCQEIAQPQVVRRSSRLGQFGQVKCGKSKDGTHCQGDRLTNHQFIKGLVDAVCEIAAPPRSARPLRFLVKRGPGGIDYVVITECQNERRVCAKGRYHFGQENGAPFIVVVQDGNQFPLGQAECRPMVPSGA